MTWREPSNDPIWLRRAQQLADAMRGKELSAEAMLSVGRVELGWAGDETRNVLAAAEGRLLLEKNGYWRVSGVASVRGLAKPATKKPPRPRAPSKTDTLDANMIRFESIACPCGERTFHRKGGGYICIGCARHYPSWNALLHPPTEGQATDVMAFEAPRGC